MTTRGRLILTVAALLVPVVAGADPDARQARVEQALSGIELIPTREDLLRLDAHVDEVLRRVALGAGSRPLARNRAITLLRLFPSPRTAATLRQLIRTLRTDRPGPDLPHLQQALGSYAVVAGPSALGLVRRFLVHPQIDLRRTAAEAVRLSRHRLARAVLLERQQREPEPLVRHQIARQIALLDRPVTR